MIRELPVKLPQSFKDALGYPGHLKWVAFYWEPCGDEAMYDDGYISGDGNWWGFLSFVKHSSVAPWLADYNLGSSDSEAKHWLLCNLESREVYVGECKEVREFLVEEVKNSMPTSGLPEGQVGISPEGIKDLLVNIREAIKELPVPSMAEVEEKMRRDQEMVEKMVAELNTK